MCPHIRYLRNSHQNIIMREVDHGSRVNRVDVRPRDDLYFTGGSEVLMLECVHSLVDEGAVRPREMRDGVEVLVEVSVCGQREEVDEE